MLGRKKRYKHQSCGVAAVPEGAGVLLSGASVTLSLIELDVASTVGAIVVIVAVSLTRGVSGAAVVGTGTLGGAVAFRSGLGGCAVTTPPRSVWSATVF